MAKIFPKLKCITKPRHYGPLKVVAVRGKGRMILMNDNKANIIRRNIRDIKKWKGIEKERPHYQINYPASLTSSTIKTSLRKWPKRKPKPIKPFRFPEMERE